MKPLDIKKKLMEDFNKDKKEFKEILSFSEFGIKINTELLKTYRSERGGGGL